MRKTAFLGSVFHFITILRLVINSLSALQQKNSF